MTHPFGWLQRFPTLRLGFGEAGRDQPSALAQVIERDHPIVKADGEVRPLEFVETRPWQALDVMAQVVAEQSRGATLKRWQLGMRFDAETGQRGYLLSGEEPYLEPYRAALAQLDQILKRLRSLTADNAPQQRRLDALEPLTAKKLDELKAEIVSGKYCARWS